MNNLEIIECGFNALCDAYSKSLVSFDRSVLYEDLLVHMDRPNEKNNRFTYAKLNEKDEIIAMCVFVFSMEKYTNDVGWFVRADYRGEGMGSSIVEMAFNEFKNGIKNAGAKLIIVTATIDEGNAPSIALGRKFIGGEEVIKKDDGSTIYSYLNEFNL